jgi:NADH dehydrogenase
LFTPLLYQVASSLLNSSDIAYPIRAVFRHSPNVRFRAAEVIGVDLERRIVHTADQPEISYDYLVLASGSRTNFFGVKSVEEVAYGLKDLPEAIALRSRVIRAFESAAAEADPAVRASWLTFVVVGGGPTGVEYAGALSELINRVLKKDYPDLDLTKVRVVLVEALNQVLPAFSSRLSADAARRLRRLGVALRLGTRVLGATGTTVSLSGGENLGCRTLVWCAGVKPSQVASSVSIATTPSHRIRVDEFLRLPEHPEAYAIGDVAAFVQDGRELAMMSPQAMQEGRYVARHMMHSISGESIHPFRYFDKGTMATIGRHAAVAQVGPFSFRGPLGWFVWLFVHLYYIIGYRNRLTVLGSWAWNYFFYDRPIRLYTGASVEPSATVHARAPAPSSETAARR